MATRFRIGSRPSALALAQAELIKTALAQLLPNMPIEIVPISTSGDRMVTAALSQVGGKGLFIRELEQALSANRIDLAVHSMKDLPATLAPQFRIAAVPSRENPRDALIARGPGGWDTLPHGARLGTSSARRRLEALRLRPDLDIAPLRGNVDTRLDRLAAGDFDAIILAMAGLRRLGRDGLAHLTELDDDGFIPAAGQGALALEVLADQRPGNSAEIERALGSLNDASTAAEVIAERSLLATIGASCVSPVGVKGTVADGRLALRVLLFSLDGSKSLAEGGDQAGTANAAALGITLGQRMIARGAADMIVQGADGIADG
jgi:hydroxymethylbilane synthase